MLQNGPPFLQLPREKWPLHQNILSSVIPKNKLRTKHEVALVNVVTADVPGWRKLASLVELTMEKSNNWQKTVAVLARVLRATLGCHLDHKTRRDLVLVSPSADDLAAAGKLQLLCSMEPSIKALKAGKLTPLELRWLGVWLLCEKEFLKRILLVF